MILNWRCMTQAMPAAQDCFNAGKAYFKSLGCTITQGAMDDDNCNHVSTGRKGESDKWNCFVKSDNCTEAGLEADDGSLVGYPVCSNPKNFDLKNLAPAKGVTTQQQLCVEKSSLPTIVPASAPTNGNSGGSTAWPANPGAGDAGSANQ
jgi:hypothetical protein